jgi:hypothetical protein
MSVCPNARDATPPTTHAALGFFMRQPTIATNAIANA